MAAELKEVFGEFEVALLHGRMKGDEKDAVMRAFAAGALHVLVATSAGQVGVDAPNATVMVDRAPAVRVVELQLQPAAACTNLTCVLVYQAPWSDDARERLKAMAATSRRLCHRGEGLCWLGTRQSGRRSCALGTTCSSFAFSEARARVEQGL